MQDASPDLPDADWKQKFRRRLKQWYARHARPLPWRQDNDPYRIWISEIMLQQTQVATVIPYFERFITAFPTIAELAAASEDAVLQHWEGLGYYRRARQLHRAAKQVVEEHQGQFPRDVTSVDALPGIGRYTRGAILSIAFDQRMPILEANTIRLYCRLLQFTGDPSSATGQRLLWQFAEDVLPRKDVGTINQAMMELGSAICTPKDPRCLICPAASLCPTRANSLQDEIPRPKRKQVYETLDETTIVVCKRDQTLIRRCQEGERWAGLWDFPRFVSPRSMEEAITRVEQMTGITAEVTNELTTIKHGVTKYRITLRCYRADYVAGKRLRGNELAWVRISDLDTYPLSVTGRKIANLLRHQ